MNLKYISKYIFLTLALITNLIVADEDSSFDSLNDMFFDFIDISQESEKGMNLDSLDNLVTNITPDDLSSNRSSCTPLDTVIILGAINTFNVASLLNLPLYKKTLIPFSRNLINYPNMQIVTYTDLADRQLTTHVFGNFTPKKNFCNSKEFKPGTRIGSYLNIENKAITNLFNQLASAFPNVPALKLDPNKLLKNLGDARFEERRLGVFLHYYHKLNEKTYWQAKLPVFWMERNLNFSQSEKEAIDRELSGFTGSDFDEDSFAKKHLIFDSLGIGTLELTANRIIWEGINWTLDVGGGLLFPTDCQFARGWYGTYFKPKDCQPILNLCDVIDATRVLSGTEYFQPNGQQILENYFVGALDRLSSILLQCQHGYSKHLGIALNAHAFWQITPDFSWNTKYCAEFLLPRENKLFFVPKNATYPKEDFLTMFNNLPQKHTRGTRGKIKCF